MSNHYHLVVETPEQNLSRGIHWLNQCYAQHFNRRHDRVGHLFQGRFKGILVERESHLLELMRYVVLNPVRAGLVDSASDYPWSSYKATAGFAAAPPWLDVGAVLAQFHPRDPRTAQSEYQRFVRAGRDAPSPWGNLVGQIYLGGEMFRSDIQKRVGKLRVTPEHPQKQLRPAKEPLNAIAKSIADGFGLTIENLRGRENPEARRAFALFAADRCHALAAIGTWLGVSPTAAGKLRDAALRHYEREPLYRMKIDLIWKRKFKKKT
jgi:hypothetical protein